MDTKETDWDVYRTAKSTRPAWATTLIIAAVIFVAAVFFTIWSGLGQAGILYLAAIVTAAIAGIQALAAMRR